jgi:hypothetical protein
MDFVTGLPTSTKQNDAIMVVVDKLSKSAHLSHQINLQGDRYRPGIHERGIQTTRYAERDSV